MENKVYAGFFVRLIAFAIDSLLAALVMFTVKAPFAMAAASGVKFLEANFIFHYSFLDVLDYVAVVAYFVLLTYFTHTTPGKMAMKLEVITIDKEWTLLNIIYRETIGRFFSSLLCAGYFAVLLSQKKQGFHDMLCDTYVVYKGVVPAPVTMPAAAPATMPAAAPVTMPQAGETPLPVPVKVMSDTEAVAQQPVVSQSEQQTTLGQEVQQPTPIYHPMPEEHNSSVE